MTSAPRKGIPLKPPENYWSFVPISPEAHEAAFQAAAQADMPLNAWLSQLIKYVGEMEQTETGETAGDGGELAEPAAGPEFNGSGSETAGPVSPPEAEADYREVEIQAVESTRRTEKRPPTTEISRYEPIERTPQDKETDGEIGEDPLTLAESDPDAPPAPPEFTGAEFAGAEEASQVEAPEFTGEDDAAKASIHASAGTTSTDTASSEAASTDTPGADFDDTVEEAEAEDDDELLDLTPDQIAKEPEPQATEEDVAVGGETGAGGEAGEGGVTPSAAFHADSEPELEPEDGTETETETETEAGEVDRSRVQPRRQFSAHVAGRASGEPHDDGILDTTGEFDGGPAPVRTANEENRRAAAGDTDDVSSGPILVPASRLRPSQMKLEAKPDEREILAALNILSETGSLQAIIVRPVADRAGGGDENNDGDAAYEIVYGETRWRAALRSRMDEVPVLVRRLTDQEALIYSVRESLVHRALSPLAEASCYQRLKDQFGLSDEDLGPSVGKPPEHVADILQFLDLPAAVRRMMEDGSISAIHARALLAADDPEAAAAEVVRRGLDIFQTEQLVRNANNGVRLGTAETD